MAHFLRPGAIINAHSNARTLDKPHRRAGWLIGMRLRYCGLLNRVIEVVQGVGIRPWQGQQSNKEINGVKLICGQHLSIEVNHTRYLANTTRKSPCLYPIPTIVSTKIAYLSTEVGRNLSP